MATRIGRRISGTATFAGTAGDDTGSGPVVTLTVTASREWSWSVMRLKSTLSTGTPDNTVKIENDSLLLLDGNASVLPDSKLVDVPNGELIIDLRELLNAASYIATNIVVTGRLTTDIAAAVTWILDVEVWVLEATAVV